MIGDTAGWHVCCCFRLHKFVDGAAVSAAAGVAYPHTSHCLGSGEIMISTMGGPDGKVRHPHTNGARHCCGTAQNLITPLEAELCSHKTDQSLPLATASQAACTCVQLGLQYFSVWMTHLQAKGNFLLLDADLNIKGTWAAKDTAYGYDFW